MPTDETQQNNPMNGFTSRNDYGTSLDRRQTSVWKFERLDTGELEPQATDHVHDIYAKYGFGRAFMTQEGNELDACDDEKWQHVLKVCFPGQTMGIANYPEEDRNQFDKTMYQFLGNTKQPCNPFDQSHDDAERSVLLTTTSNPRQPSIFAPQAKRYVKWDPEEVKALIFYYTEGLFYKRIAERILGRTEQSCTTQVYMVRLQDPHLAPRRWREENNTNEWPGNVDSGHLSMKQQEAFDKKMHQKAEKSRGSRPKRWRRKRSKQHSV